METITLYKDIDIIFVQATTFPEGILGAFDTLNTKVPDLEKRRKFGLSRPENGRIIYKAAAEKLSSGEGEGLHLHSMQIPKGTYVSILVKDFMKNVTAVGSAFNQLLGESGIDPQGYCVECYINATDVQCMVRLAD